MKKLTAFLTLLISIASSAQNTWVQKLSYSITMGGYIDTLTGVRQIEVGPDGSAFVLASLYCHNQQAVFKFLPNSNQVEWSMSVGSGHASGPDWTERIRATSDSGFISCHDNQWGMDPTSGSVIKYAKDGTLQWTRGFPWWDTSSLTDRPAYDVLEKSPGIYCVLISDSMYTLDNSGYLIDSTGAIHGTRFMQLDNGDFLIWNGTNWLQRVDTTGNVIWSQLCNGPFAYDTSGVFIVNNSNIKKVDAVTGVIQWNNNYGFFPISDISASHDGGFIASVGYKPKGDHNWGFGVASPGHLLRVDSLGDTLWTRTYNVPRNGLSAFTVMPGGNIFTGGGYMSSYTFSGWGGEHSTFCCMMNSDGSYPLEQTNYISTSDANHDFLSNYVDDVLETLLALGKTGPSRDTALDMNMPYGVIGCDLRDLAIDWPTSSNAGINHKYADYDGNGIIDMADVASFQNCNMGVGDSLSVSYRFRGPDHTQSVEEFCLVPLSDTIQPGSDAYY
jgi:hypothetical protein